MTQPTPQTVRRILDILAQLYPLADCTLDHKDGLQLLVSVRLAAQCTDARVNQISPALFARYPTMEAFAEADVEELESYIRSCGFYHAKARDIIACTRTILDRYNGVIPDDIDTLVTLPGVGRKTANLIVGDLYGKPAIVTDTHCIRISNRLGLAHTKDPYKVELALRAVIPPEESNDFCHRLVLHGRAVCDARKPRCSECALAEVCKYAKEQAADV